MARRTDDCACDLCGTTVPHDQSVAMVDCWWCRACYDRWLADVFTKCQHDWKPAADEHGEPARYCDKCCGMERTAPAQPA